MPDEPAPRRNVNGNIEVHVAVSGTRVRKSYILACAKHGAQRLMRPLGHLNVVIIGDHQMKKLHFQYMNLKGTTDVLTFDLTGPVGSALDGDIYISLHQAKRQAKEHGVGLNEELARLAVHGVLHLAGFRDKSVIQKRQMRWMEAQSLAAAGSANDR